MIETFGELAWGNTWIVEESLDTFGGSPGMGMGARNALSHCGDNGSFRGKDATDGEGNDVFQAAVRKHVEEWGEEGGQGVLQFGQWHLVKDLVDQYTFHSSVSL